MTLAVPAVRLSLNVFQLFAEKAGEFELKIYVGNLNYDVTVDQIRELFAQHGTVQDVATATDSEGKPRGFGFVFMPDAEEARAAIKALNGTRFHDRPLNVSEPQSKKDAERKRSPSGKSTSVARPFQRGYRARTGDRRRDRPRFQ